MARGENKRGVRLIVAAGRTQGTPLPVSAESARDSPSALRGPWWSWIDGVDGSMGGRGAGGVTRS